MPRRIRISFSYVVYKSVTHIREEFTIQSAELSYAANADPLSDATLYSNVQAVMFVIESPINVPPAPYSPVQSINVQLVSRVVEVDDVNTPPPFVALFCEKVVLVILPHDEPLKNEELTQREAEIILT